jgi:chromosomal replication initiation ATPase DnaA
MSAMEFDEEYFARPGIVDAPLASSPRPIAPPFEHRPPRDILLDVCRTFGVTLGSLVGKERHKSIVRARHAAYWLLRRAKLSFPEIGREVGKRDHTTIMSGVRHAEKLRVSDPLFAMAIEGIVGPSADVKGAA